MIADFILSWDLFHNTYLAGGLIAVVLGLIGVLVVARDQIFIGAAVSQASMLGLTIGMWVGHSTTLSVATWYEFDIFVSACGSLFAVTGALLTTLPGRLQHESREVVTGWVFATGMGLSVLLVSHSPHGMEEVHRLLASTLIGANATDVVAFALLVTISVAMLAWRQDEIVLTVMDPGMARAIGVRVRRWEVAINVWLGICVALSLRVSGLVFTFGCLVLPAIVAKNICREIRSMFIVAPLLALITSLVAFVVAHAWDYPPAHLTIAMLSAAVASAWLARGQR